MFVGIFGLLLGCSKIWVGFGGLPPRSCCAMHILQYFRGTAGVLHGTMLCTLLFFSAYGLLCLTCTLGSLGPTE